MQAVSEHLTADDIAALAGAGQSNRNAWGHRDREGFVACPHLKLRPAGMDLTILSIVGQAAGAHGAVGTLSVVNVADQLAYNDWVNGELRLVQHEFGDAVASTRRRGHAKVISCAPAIAASTDPLLSQVVTFDVTADTVYWPNHGRSNGSTVAFRTTGALPGLTANAPHFVRDATQHTFKVSVDPHGTAVNLAGGSGTHFVYACAFLVVQWVSEFQAAVAVTFDNFAGALRVNSTAHGRTAGSTVSFTASGGGVLPTGVGSGQNFYVFFAAADTYLITPTYGGLPQAFVDAGTTPTVTATPGMLANISGYVHLHDRFNSYDNVYVTTPFQPIEPGDYPAGVPAVPGFTLDPDVLQYSDAGLCLPFAWNEGIDGDGKIGNCEVSGLTVTFSAPLAAGDDKLFADGFIRVGNSKAVVATNSTTTATVKAWIPAAPPAGVTPFHLHLPHWRNNPAHFTAGEGFLYPSNCMQPGGLSALSTGMTYSRPRGRLSGSCVGKLLQGCTTSTATNSTGVARIVAGAPGDLQLSVVSSLLRIQRASATSDPTTQLIQFEAIIRSGYIVNLAGITGLTDGVNPIVVNGNWRVVGMGHTYGGAGSYIDLEQLSAQDPAVPSAVVGVAPAGSTVLRTFYEPQHRFGSLLENGWRISLGLGRAVLWSHLGVNSSGQIAASTNNAFAFQGKLGWFDDDLNLTWTPSDPDSNAVRFERLITFITPRAVHASFGPTKNVKFLCGDFWNMEADALTAVGREMAQRTVPTFVDWFRGIVDKAGLSPYPKGARLPVHWAQLRHEPWELDGLFYGQQLSGDKDGKVRAALLRQVAFDGFTASINTDTAPTLDGTTSFGADPLHFNGLGEAANAKAASAEILRLIDFAFSFSLGKGETTIANQALMLAAEYAALNSLEIDDGTEAMRLCLAAFPDAKDAVLAYHPWSFATHTVAWIEVENTSTMWDHAYAVPPDCLKPTGVFDPEASDDTQDRGTEEGTSQPSRVETDLEGHRVLRTDQADAVVRYTRRNVDVGNFDPEARNALAWRLVHYIAPGILKGKDGRKLSQEALQMSEALLARAAAENTQFQQDVKPPEPPCDWLPKQRSTFRHPGLPG